MNYLNCNFGKALKGSPRFNVTLIDVDADQLQRDLQRLLLRWSASRSLSNNLARVTGGLAGNLENNLTSTLMEEDTSWLKGPGKIVARLWIVGLTPRGSRWRCADAVNSYLLRVILLG